MLNFPVFLSGTTRWSPSVPMCELWGARHIQVQVLLGTVAKGSCWCAALPSQWISLVHMDHAAVLGVHGSSTVKKRWGKD